MMPNHKVSTEKFGNQKKFLLKVFNKNVSDNDNLLMKKKTEKVELKRQENFL